MNNFEVIKKHGSKGREFWYAHELALALNYTSLEFIKIAKVAEKQCWKNGFNHRQHFFTDIAGRVMLSRYACNLIAHLADMNRPEVLMARTYFSILSQKQELDPQDANHIENYNRTMFRSHITDSNRELNKMVDSVFKSDPQLFALFNNAGYQGFYDEMGAAEVRDAKKLKPDQKILDHMISTEMSANLAIAELAKQEIIFGKKKKTANQLIGIHKKAGRRVRESVVRVTGVTPENFPVPEKSVKEL